MAKEDTNNVGVGCIAMLVLMVIVYACFPSGTGTNRDSTQSGTVENSAWDGSVRQVDRWLRASLKDPDSLQYVSWSPVVKSGSDYRVRVKYRAKNSFGGYVVEQKLVTLNSAGVVIDAQDY